MNAEQRALFEAWAKDHGYNLSRQFGLYEYGATHAAERVWKACLAANATNQPADDERERLRDLLKWAANLKPDIELAQLANDGAEFRKDFCTCDPSVGMSPCQYCVIHDVLRRMLELSQHCAAALGTREERG